MGDIDVRQILAIQTYPIRLAILRPGGAPEEAIFPGDDEQDAVHFGAFAEDRLAGVASVHRRSRPGLLDTEAWQLRGMATLPEFQKQGMGRALIEVCVVHVREHGGRILWCNARLSASEFYEKMGFAVVSDLFEIAGVGPHYVMEYRATPAVKPTPAA